MNTKTKHFSWSGLAYALVLILLATTMVGIVAYAAGSKTHNIGGNVSFSADAVEATITGASYEGCTISSSSQKGTLKDITYSTTLSDDNSSTYAETWDNLTVDITDTTNGDATLSFTITNKSDFSIQAAVTAQSYDSTAVEVSYAIDPEDGIMEANGTATVTITFQVKDTNYSLAEAVSFTVEVKLSEYNAPTLATANATYTLNTSSQTATLTSYTGTETSVSVASTVYVDENTITASSISANSISAQSTSLTAYTVTAISANAFGTNDTMTFLKIPKTITKIGDNAFVNCSALATIQNLSNTLTITAGDYGTSTSATVSTSDVVVYADSNAIRGYSINMGYFPQSEVTDLTGLMNVSSSLEYAENTYVQYGSNYYLCEPIVWDVIAFYDTNDLDGDAETEIISDVATYGSRLNDEQVIVLSHSGLEAMAFEDSGYWSWKSADIYDWLNNTFYSSAFTTEEQSYIASHDDSETAGTTTGNGTWTVYSSISGVTSKVWLLSTTEVDSWFTWDSWSRAYSELNCYNTDYSLATGAYGSSDGTGSRGRWWLRSRGTNSPNVCYVSSGGIFSNTGVVSDTNYVARPALLINL